MSKGKVDNLRKGTTYVYEALPMYTRYYLCVRGTIYVFEVLPMCMRYYLCVRGTTYVYEVIPMSTRYYLSKVDMIFCVYC